MVTRVLDGLVANDVAAAGGLLARGSDWHAAEGRGPETVATGFSSLDRLLPAGGVRRGSVIEWHTRGDDADGDAGGAISLACAVACRLAASAPQASTSQASTIVVVDRGQRFHPPAMFPWLESAADVGGKSRSRPQLVVARPSRDDDELWTIDQALRCPGVAAVLAWPKRVHTTAMRRWQLATRASGAVGLLVRGLSERKPVGREPTWADAKLAVAPVVGDAASDLAVRRLRISLVGGPWSVGESLQMKTPHERSTELLLDLTNGREASGRRMPVRNAIPVVDKHLQAGRFQRKDMACHAS